MRSSVSNDLQAERTIKRFWTRIHIIRFLLEKESSIEKLLEREGLGNGKPVGRILQYSGQEKFL